jgi:hypothetical protein
MRTTLTAGVICALACATAQTAEAQYGARRLSDPATGETYHVEFSTGYWNPGPLILITSESIEIAGDQIDLVNDLGITKKRFTDLRLVLRPARKHKFRFSYTPIKYSADTIIQRSFVFNGQRYTIGLPVQTELDWKAIRFGYEYDFIHRDRGFVGFIVEAKYTDVKVRLASPLLFEFAEARAPIPAIGGIGRIYVMPNISATFELTGFRLPNFDEKYRAKYIDLDVYGTLNFTNNVGVQAGYRRLDIDYVVDLDAGDLTLKGPYFAGVVRF